MPCNPEAMFISVPLGDFSVLIAIEKEMGIKKKTKKRKNLVHKVYQILYKQKIDFVSLAINFNSNGSMSRLTFL